MNNDQNENKSKEYQKFALTRMFLASVFVIALVWALALGLGYLEKPGRIAEWIGSRSALVQKKDDIQKPEKQVKRDVAQGPKTEGQTDTAMAPKEENQVLPQAVLIQQDEQAETPSTTSGHLESEDKSDTSTSSAQIALPAKTQETKPSTNTKIATVDKHGATDDTHAPSAVQEKMYAPKPVGVTFVEAVMKPIENELKYRFWGWRPNDILNLTDNVNSFQLGVLEVTRRTAVQLAERISRTGTTDSFNPNLENAMNWLMVTATRYWFPSPESKYIESLDELSQYKAKLMLGNASFYTRTDSLIPLLAAYEDLLGSCDENLVKDKERDGSPVSYFKVDDYFYYAKGVASAMATILEAVHHDFEPILDSRHGTELLHHALESCRRAADLDPWLITNGDLDGFLANHRANMAAPISHARFFLGQLVKTLNT